MRKLLITLILASAALAPSAATPQDACSMLNGAVIIAQDDANTYLGKIALPYDSDSIFNEY